MADITEAQLRADLKNNKLSNTYLLFGPDHYTINAYAKSIIKKALGSADRDMNLHEFEGKTPDISAITDACDSLPVFADYNVCTVDDLRIGGVNEFSKDKYDMLISAIKDMPETTVFIIYYSSIDICAGKKKADARYKRLADNCAKYGTACFFPYKTPAANAPLIASYVKKRGGSISERDAMHLSELCAGNSGLIYSETDKLLSYANGAPITSDMIDMLCVGQNDAKIYELTDAVMRRDKTAAIKLFRELCDMQSEPIALLYGIQGSVIDRFRLSMGTSAGRSPSDIASDFSYGARSFALTKAAKGAGRSDPGQLAGYIRLLIDCERQLKSRPTALHTVIMEETIIRMLSY